MIVDCMKLASAAIQAVNQCRCIKFQINRNVFFYFPEPPFINCGSPYSVDSLIAVYG